MNKITSYQVEQQLQKQAFLGNWLRAMRLKPNQVSQSVRDAVSTAEKVMGGAKNVVVKTPSAASAMSFSGGIPPDFRVGNKLADFVMGNVLGQVTIPRGGGLPDVSSGYRIFTPKGLMTSLIGKKPGLAHEAAEAISHANLRAMTGQDSMMSVYRGFRLPKLPAPLAKLYDKSKFGQRVEALLDDNLLRGPTTFITRGADGRIIVGAPVGQHFHPAVYSAETLAATPFEKFRMQRMRHGTGEGRIVREALKHPDISSDITLTPGQVLDRLGIKNEVIAHQNGIETLVNTRRGWFS